MIDDARVAQPRFTGLGSCIHTTVQEEGYRGIYRGGGPVVCASSLYEATLTRPALTARCDFRHSLFVLLHPQTVGAGQCSAWHLDALLAVIRHRCHGQCCYSL
jgi:hypothetical protein